MSECQSETRARNAVRHVQDNPVDQQDNSSDDSTDEYAYALQGETLCVMINGVQTHMVNDSGATCNVINSEVASRLEHTGLVSRPCKKRIFPYASPPLRCNRFFTTDVSARGSCVRSATFLVLEGDAVPLLGRTTAKALGVLKTEDDIVNHVTHPPTNNPIPMEALQARYPDLWKGIGCLKDTEVMIHIDPTVPPIARKHSRVPFHNRAKVAAEIDKLIDADIIERVTGPTPWVSRIVTPPKPKKPDEIRLCVDMRDANKAILRTRHVTPTMDELITELSGATVFSKIDLRSGYHQLTLHPSCRYITAFSTHMGVFQYKRLCFGISSAAEIFQDTIQSVIADIPGARNISDDVIIYGTDQAAHDRALDQTLRRLYESGLTANAEKCEFSVPKISFFGVVFSQEGVSPDPEKVQALQKAAKPANASEVRSFLGMAQYSARFIPNFSTIASPLRELTKQGVEWQWTAEHDQAFRAIQDSLSETATTAFFDVRKESSILVDASPRGVAAVLTQDGKPIAFSSRALTNVEARYSQTEREALAIVWACEHFHIYVNGSAFRVITDHQPLTHIWRKPNPPARIARWALRLQPYNFAIEYRPGKNNPADYMSRHPTDVPNASSREQFIAEEYVSFLAKSGKPLAITLEDVVNATNQDATLQFVISLIRSGRWYEADSEQPSDVDRSSLLALRSVRDELTVSELGILLRDTRVVIPSELQPRAVALAHEGHQGITKTKALIRSKVWFPGIDAAVEQAVSHCLPCQVNSNRKQHEPLSMTPLPRGPWLDISIDFCGPFPAGEYLLVMTDEYSRFPVVEIVRSTSAATVIPIVDRVFSMFGLPEVIKSDNGPPFTGHEWKQFLVSCGVKHRKITPLWPRSNAQVENFNKPLMKTIRTAVVEHRDWKASLNRFLQLYRSTPHRSTLFSPFRLMFQREPRTKLPELPQQSQDPVEPMVRIQDAIAKQTMKRYTDGRNRAKKSELNVGDSVIVRQPKTNKFSTPFNPVPLTVTKKTGSMVTASRENGSAVTRNSSFFRKLPQGVTGLPHNDEDDHSETDVADIDDPVGSPQAHPVPTTRPTRLKRRPQRLIEEM